VNDSDDEEKEIRSIMSNKQPDPGFDSFVIIRKYSHRMYDH